MIDYKEALEIITSAAKIMDVETVALRDSLNRILAIDIFQDMDVPPFDKSAMDGYACRFAEIANELEVVETIYAGKSPEKRLKKNQCSKIMTGAVVPVGADCVFKKEDSKNTGENKVICTNPGTTRNILLRGEDLRVGDQVLGKSTFLTPRHLPALAGAGITGVEVFQQPKIKIFATGTELVEPDKKPLGFQIRNSNSSQLLAQLTKIGVDANYGGILTDETEQIQNEIESAFHTNNLVILTGGVSVGDYDLIPDIMDNLGFQILIRATGIKPGKPMSFACKNDKFCFGLSGNPVSSFVQFELYVKPFVFSMMGYKYQPPSLKLPLAIEYNRKKADRINIVPVNINDKMEIVPIEFHGSAHINALSSADFLMEVPKDVLSIMKGDLVNVRSIQ